MSNEIKIEYRDKATIVQFTRPETRNPLSVTVLDQLDEIVDDVGDRSELVALIFTGMDESFASGADLREIAAITAEAAPDFARKGQDLMAKIARLSQTTIAAINGFCFGGALDLTLACDWRIASPNARFAHPGTGLGIITGWGGTQRLPRVVGQANALEMFFTAEAVDAKRALRIGLVDIVVEDIMKESLTRFAQRKRYSKAY
jgi:enoyl-CoA hydratase